MSDYIRTKVITIAHPDGWFFKVQPSDDDSSWPVLIYGEYSEDGKERILNRHTLGPSTMAIAIADAITEIAGFSG